MNCCGNRHPIPLGEEHRAADILLHERPEITTLPVKHCNYCHAEHYYSHHAFRLDSEPTITAGYAREIIPTLSEIRAGGINVSGGRRFHNVSIQPQSVSRASLERYIEREDVVDELIN